MDRMLKVGVFGAARGMCMIDVLAVHPDARIVAVCDKYRPLLDKVQKKADDNHIAVHLYECFEDFIEEDMDAVVLANYATEHAIYAVKALRKGKHVLSECLPCETMAQAVELVEAVEETGLVYAYAENYCYMDRTFEMWRRAKNGDIGSVTYMEGEYIHDCAAIWPAITYGERNHWRNLMHATFYCTHSIGPMLTISGQRPVRVCGFETPYHEKIAHMGSLDGSSGGIEMLVLENGAIAKSVHGGLKREPGSINYEVYGTRGSMETNRFDDDTLQVYMEGDKVCKGTLERYKPQKFVDAELAETVASHGGSDFYATHFFIQKILGRQSGLDYSIDVYQALDMGICGLMAIRSILDGNKPYDIPNFRNKEEREPFRYDNICTNPAVAGPDVIPCTINDVPRATDEELEQVRKWWLAGQDAE